MPESPAVMIGRYRLRDLAIAVHSVLELVAEQGESIDLSPFSLGLEPDTLEWQDEEWSAVKELLYGLGQQSKGTATSSDDSIGAIDKLAFDGVRLVINTEDLPWVLGPSNHYSQET